jgi:tetratricopeptide (TPR) repeat protein
MVEHGGVASAPAAEERAEFRAGADAELAVRAVQMRLDRLDGQEQPGRGFLVREPSRGVPLAARAPRVLAYLCARFDATAEAVAGAEELLSRDLSSWHVDSEWLFSVTLLAEAVALLGGQDRAAALYDVLLPYGSLNAVAPIEAALGSASRALGLLATVLGRFSDAVRHFDEALRMNTTMGAQPSIAHTEYDYARMLAARGEPGDRERAIDRAAARSSAIAVWRWSHSRAKPPCSSARSATGRRPVRHPDRSAAVGKKPRAAPRRCVIASIAGSPPRPLAWSRPPRRSWWSCATPVRMVLPGRMQLLGDLNWWIPRWLEDIPPRIDVEAAALAPASASARA